MAVFAGETVMRDTRHSSACLQSWLHEILFKFNWILNSWPMTKSRWYAIENNETAQITTGV